MVAQLVVLVVLVVLVAVVGQLAQELQPLEVLALPDKATLEELDMFQAQWIIRGQAAEVVLAQ